MQNLYSCLGDKFICTKFDNEKSEFAGSLAKLYEKLISQILHKLTCNIDKISKRNVDYFTHISIITFILKSSCGSLILPRNVSISMENKVAI